MGRGTPIERVQTKVQELRHTGSYSESEILGEKYWAKWEKKGYEPRQGSMVDQEALGRVATRLGYKDIRKFKHICKLLKDGDPLGMRRDGRMRIQLCDTKVYIRYVANSSDKLRRMRIQFCDTKVFMIRCKQSIKLMGIRIQPRNTMVHTICLKTAQEVGI